VSESAWIIFGACGWLLSAYWWKESQRLRPISIKADKPVPINVHQTTDGATTVHIMNGGDV
jgi:hypothetical protein